MSARPITDSGDNLTFECLYTILMASSLRWADIDFSLKLKFPFKFDFNDLVLTPVQCLNRDVFL
jgi:hypothetical protein